ncbi:MAG: hypothetical protein K6T86_15460 [Pirellulales bacterium]|nr:hypothetical protein [Pirellulales bacterium]
MSLLEYDWLTWDERALATMNRMWERIQQRRNKGLPLLSLPVHGDTFICTLAEWHPDPKVREAAKAALLESLGTLLKSYADQPANLNDNKIMEFRLLAAAHEIIPAPLFVEAARKRMRRWQDGEWYGDAVFPGWPGMAASSIPWIFPALHRDEREH